jgi:hypothetical protein
MKNVQYIIIDSQYVTGTNNVFSVTFGNKSNVFIQEMRDVIGIKVVDFYATNVGASTNQYIDVLGLDVPTSGQILNERSAQLLLRVPLERNISGSNNLVIYDKQWVPFQQKTCYFNPITIKQLRFKINALTSDGSYVPLQAGIGFTMTIEITTLDRDQPPEDTNLLVVEQLKKLSKRMDRLNVSITNIPVVQPDKDGKIPIKYLFFTLVGILVIAFMLSWMMRSSSKASVPVPGAPQVQGLGQVPRPPPVMLPAGGPLRPPGALPQGLL